MFKRFSSGGPERGHPGGPPIYAFSVLLRGTGAWPSWGTADTYIYMYIHIYPPIHMYIHIYIPTHPHPTYISFPHIDIIYQCFYSFFFLLVIYSLEMGRFVCPYFFR